MAARQGRSQDPSPSRVFTVTSARAFTADNGMNGTVAFNDETGTRYTQAVRYTVVNGTLTHENVGDPILAAPPAKPETAPATS